MAGTEESSWDGHSASSLASGLEVNSHLVFPSKDDWNSSSCVSCWIFPLQLHFVDILYMLLHEPTGLLNSFCLRNKIIGHFSKKQEAMHLQITV